MWFFTWSLVIYVIGAVIWGVYKRLKYKNLNHALACAVIWPLDVVADFPPDYD